MSSSAQDVIAEEMGVMRGERDAGGRQDSRWRRFRRFPSPMFVRYIYTLLFFVATICAWVLRESHETFFKRQRRSGCNGDRDCLAADAVLVISHTCFLFFSIMFLSTVCTSKLKDCRNTWHCQCWLAKIVLLVGSILISTFVPTYWIQLYGKIAPFGAGIFLVIQLISGMRLVTRLNYKWCLTNFETRHLHVISVSIITYNSSMVGIILMSLWYTGCGLNIAFIAITLLLVLLMPLISIKSEANGFYMEPGIVGAYIVFLCFSAINSEPETKCYKKEKSGAWAHFKTIASFVAGLVSTVAAVFSTGSDYQCIHLRNVVVSEDDVPYGYGFFHFVFTVGSMYFGMLFVGWDTHHTMEMWNIDVSWTSAWVHIANEGLTVISFVAILLARIYGIGRLRQLLAWMFGIGDQHHRQRPPFEMNDIPRSGRNDDAAAAAAAAAAATARVGAPPPPPLSQRTEGIDDDMIQSSIDHGPPPSPVEEQEIMPADTAAIVLGRSRNRIRIRNDDDAAGASSSSAAPPPPPAAAGPVAAAGGGRHNWRIGMPTRRGMLFCLCLQVTLICFSSLYYMLYT